jgi:putative (di)nucleoside polyphosphate hydrolase
MYRKGAGIILLNKDKKVFVGKRNDAVYQDAWQMPQGGINENEEPLQAAFRELKEEIGTNEVNVLSEYPGWLKYNIPQEMTPKVWQGKFVGQEQKWYLMMFEGNDTSININTQAPEFYDWKWESPENLVTIIIPFKKELYSKLVRYFLPIIKNIN